MVIKNSRIKKVLKKSALKDFNNFMTGQTAPIGGIYDNDFLRWIKEWPVID